MSGTIQSRVNRGWDSTTRVNTSAARFFWEWLHYVNDHPGLNVVQVGTGTTSHGVTIPAEWLAWDGTTDPTALAPIALDSNSWLVFEAVNADNLLDGGGSNPWQAKIQVAHSGVAYTDPSGTDYGKNAEADIVVLRATPYGGWTGSPTWDYVPPSGEGLPPDQSIYKGQDEDWYLDIVGDDDTIVWKGAAGDWPTDTPETRSRGGYLGMIVRRSPNISYPFWVATGTIDDASAAAGDNAVNSRATTNSYFVWRYVSGAFYWPTFSIGADKSACTGHSVAFPSGTMCQLMAPNPWTGDRNYFTGILREYQSPNHWSVMGQLRFLWACDYSYGQHTLVGDNEDLIQICDSAGSYGGILMQWPGSVLPIW